MVYFAVIEAFGEGFVTRSSGFYDEKSENHWILGLCPH
jgi:hypothetical protein